MTKEVIFNVEKDFSLIPYGLTKKESKSSAQSLLEDHLVPLYQSLEDDQKLVIVLNSKNDDDYFDPIINIDYICSGFLGLYTYEYCSKDEFLNKIDFRYFKNQNDSKNAEFLFYHIQRKMIELFQLKPNQFRDSNINVFKDRAKEWIKSKFNPKKQKTIFFNLPLEFSTNPRGLKREDSDVSAEALLFDHLIPLFQGLKDDEKLCIELTGRGICSLDCVVASNYIKHGLLGLLFYGYCTKNEFKEKVSFVYDEHDLDSNLAEFMIDVIHRYINTFSEDDFYLKRKKDCVGNEILI